MKTIRNTLICALAAFGISPAIAEEGIVATVETGCATEIEQFCSQVTKGEGRLLACFYAHEDKISGQCQYALYQASAQLEAAVVALDYMAGECEDDILAHCGDVQVGEGRVIECLQGKGEAVSESCRTAMDKVLK